MIAITLNTAIDNKLRSSNILLITGKEKLNTKRNILFLTQNKVT